MKANIIKINWKIINEFKLRDTFQEGQDIGIPAEYFKNNVLYQIYGDSPIYGQNTLLYIGRTETLQRRIKEHVTTKLSRVTNMTIRFGEFDLQYLEEPKQDVEYLLKIVETILITMVKPSYNSENLHNISKEIQVESDSIYWILNTGDKGILPLEVSNIWWHLDK